MESPPRSTWIPGRSCRPGLESSDNPYHGSTASTLNVRESKGNLTAPDKMFQASWWRRRTRLERRLIILGITALFTCSALITAIILISVRATDDSQWNLCTTADCLFSANHIHENIDAEFSPCDDFFRFACGNWMNGSSIPIDSDEMDVFSELQDEVNLHLRMKIEKPKTEDEPKAVSDGKDFYAACMDTAMANANGRKLLLSWMQAYGGWPVTMPNWTQSAFNWKQSIVNLTKENMYLFISVNVSEDVKNTSENMLYVEYCDSMTNEYDTILNPVLKQWSKGYRRLMHDMAETLLSGYTTVSEEDLDDILNFESGLRNITASTPESIPGNSDYNKWTIGELVNATNAKFDWIWYLNEVFEDIYNFTEDSVLIVSHPLSLKVFFDYMETVDNRTIANYLMWHYVFSYAILTDSITVGSLFEFKNQSSVIAPLPLRWKTCVESVDYFFPHVTASLFVDGYVKNGTKSKATDLVNDIRNSLVNVLQANTWMDPQTLDRAVKKAKAMGAIVDFPDNVSNATLLNKAYENFVPSSIHIENIRNVLMYESTSALSEINKPVDQPLWDPNPDEVNAYYLPTRNSVVIPAGILQRPFFGANNLKAVNYGSIGTIIGHEMTHGFDAIDMKNDEKGNLIQWWTDYSLEAYNRKVDCIRNQYSHYCATGLKRLLKIFNITKPVCVDGSATLNENIADIGGLKIAFNAYTSWVKENGPEPRLPGLMQYTPEQLFFISFAQTYCVKDTVIGLYKSLWSNNHSPDIYRVLGALQNSEDFAKVFQCPKNSMMNPMMKCTFW